MKELSPEARACVLCPQTLVEQLHARLDEAAILEYSELRLQAALRRREQHFSEATLSALAAALSGLDLKAALYFSSPREAWLAWQQLDTQPAAPALERERYIGAVDLLAAGLGPGLEPRLPALRNAALAQDFRDRRLCRAMLLDALHNGDRALARLAQRRLQELGEFSSDWFDWQAAEFGCRLLEEIAWPQHFEGLLSASRSYADWQLLNGALWELALRSGIGSRQAWKLHLEAHARCHQKIYDVLAAANNN